MSVVVVSAVIVVCTVLIIAAILLHRDTLKTGIDELRTTLAVEFSQRTSERAGAVEYAEMVSEAGRVSLEAQQAVNEMRSLVDESHREYKRRTAALDEREESLREREEALGITTGHVPEPEDDDVEGEFRRPIALGVDPKNPPKIMIYQPTGQHAKKDTPMCECHDEPINAGDTLMWWPDAKIEGAVHMFCTRGVKEMASQGGQS